jgi:choline dehydrogenase-like flavoprotein
MAPSHVEAARLIEEALVLSTSPAEQRRFRMALQGLENSALCLLTTGDARPLRKRGPRGRERLLRAWSRSPIPQLRQVFQIIKRLAAYTFYAAHGDSQSQSKIQNLKSKIDRVLGYPDGWQAPTTPALPANPHNPIRPLEIGEGDVLEADACVIGSGAGGGVMAALLAQAGYRVVVLEAGDALSEADFDGDEDAGWRRLYARRGLLTTADGGIAILAGRTLGGGTTVNWMTCFRTPEQVLSQWAATSGISALLGPELQASLDAVEKRVNMGKDESWVNGNNAALARGAAALGWHHDVQARNARGCGDCGLCSFGCPYGGKQSTPRTYLQDAYDAGARIVVRATAERVLFEGKRAVGVEAIVSPHGPAMALPWRAQQPGARRVRVKAPVVVVAGGGIESPALLLRSGLKHNALGRNLYLHPATALMGVFDEEIVAWSGPMQSTHSDQFADLDGEGYGFKLEATPIYPGIAATALAWEGGADFKSRMPELRHTASILVLVRERVGGRVGIDRWGNPHIRYALSKVDAAHLLKGCKEGVRLLMAADAREAYTLHTKLTGMTRAEKDSPSTWRRFERTVGRQGAKPNGMMLFSAHQMGTCRMGLDPDTTVVNAHGAVHGYKGLYVADGSIFPLPSGVNPMISIMGLAHWIGSRMVQNSPQRRRGR